MRHGDHIPATLRLCAAWVVAALLLVAPDVQGQTVAPTSIDFGSDSAVCTGGLEETNVSITLPEGTTTNKVDVFLLFDDTGSYAGFVSSTAAVFEDVIDDLEAALPTVEFGFGIGRFEDYHGGSGFSGETTSGRPFILNQPIVTAADAGGDAARDGLITTALGQTAPGFGGDGPESAIAEGLFQVAEGIGFDGNGDGDTEDSGAAGAVSTQTSPGTSGDVPAFSSLDPSVVSSGTLGGAGWRSDAQKIVIVATDVCSVAAYDPAEGVPATITGTGGTEPSSAFHCSGTEGSGRFGFVADAKTSGANTVSGAVVPSEAGTVPATIAALNSLGIQVVGLGPGASPTNSTTPTFAEDTFLSALARITGAVRDDGTPLVFDVSAASGLSAALVDAIDVATTSDIDITLDTSTLPAGLSFGFSPGVVENVGPTDTAEFVAEFTGDGSLIDGTFDLLFKNAASNNTLGTIPVTASCTGECDVPTLGDNIVDEAARTVSNTISDQDGIESFTFSTLNNFTVASIAPMAGYTRSGDTWTWTDSGPAPTSVDFTLQAGPSGEALYFLEVTDGCTDPGPNTTDFDPPFDLGPSSDLAFALDGSYPNPTRGAATVRFALDETAPVQLAVYDVMGRKVAMLVDGPVAAGEHEVRWNGRSADGRSVASGVYLLRLEAGDRVATRRLTVVK